MSDIPEEYKPYWQQRAEEEYPELAGLRRELADAKQEIERLLSLDGDRCKSHNFYLIRSSRLEDEVARNLLDIEALTTQLAESTRLNARNEEWRKALEFYAEPLNWAYYPHPQGSGHDDVLQITEGVGYTIAATALKEKP